MWRLLAGCLLASEHIRIQQLSWFTIDGQAEMVLASESRRSSSAPRSKKASFLTSSFPFLDLLNLGIFGRFLQPSHSGWDEAAQKQFYCKMPLLGDGPSLCNVPIYILCVENMKDYGGGHTKYRASI